MNGSDISFVFEDDKKFFSDNAICSLSIIKETLIERAIIRTALENIFAVRGDQDDQPAYKVSVHDGEELVLRGSQDISEIMGAIMTTDEDALIVREALTGKLFGQIMLVYGNDGFDVISDHSGSLDGLLSFSLDLDESIVSTLAQFPEDVEADNQVGRLRSRQA